MTTSLETYQHKYGASQQHLHELLQWAEDPAIRGTMPAQMLEEMSTALEELHVAAEVMHDQAEQLAAAQQDIEKERCYFQELFDLAPDGYLVTDQEGVIRRANQAAADLFRTQPKFLDGKPLAVLIWPEDRQSFRAWVEKAARHGGRDEWEGRMSNRSGGSFPVALSIATTRTRNGQIDHCRWLLRDLTEHKQMERKLRERAEKLEKLNRGKDDFLAMLGHELRNPLVPLRNLAPILAKDSSPERIDWAMGVLRRQVISLTRLVDDMLDVSRLSRGKVQVRREPLEFGRIVRAAVEDHRGGLQENGVTLTLDAPEQPVPVLGDATRLTQVMNNLLHNAAKFTPPGGRVSVRLKREPDSAVVRIHDTGRGIPPDLLPHLFDAFVQGKSNIGGLGLGLALVKGLVELHGGEVTIRSDGHDRGTTAEVWLPLVDSLSPPPAPAPQSRPRRLCRILVIDDNRDVAESLRHGLATFGHQVEAAYTGPEGLAAVRRAPPEVVVCDLGMAEMSGYTVAKALQRERKNGSLRLIAYTGYGQEDISRRTEEAGFDLCLTKPLDLEQLNNAVARAAVAK